jgi:hypothetical protein
MVTVALPRLFKDSSTPPVPSFASTEANARYENHNDPRSPAEHNRLFGRRQKIAEKLIASGGNSERNSRHSLGGFVAGRALCGGVRRQAVRPSRFEAVLRALAESGGEIGRKARSSLEWRSGKMRPPSLLGPRMPTGDAWDNFWHGRRAIRRRLASIAGNWKV